MHRLSNNGRTTVCGRPLDGYTVIRTRQGPRVARIRYTTVAKTTRCAECKAIVAEYERAYGPYSVEAGA